MYKVICYNRKIAFSTTFEYFETKKQARYFIKQEKQCDKKLHNPHGLYFNYKIVKI